MSYISLSEAKTFLFPRGDAPSVLDAFITAELEALDDIIDQKCGRKFTAGDPGEIRYFDGTGENYLFIDDLITLTKLEYRELDSDAWTEIPSGTYLTSGIPIYKIILLSNAITPYFPEGDQNIRITGTWGWPSVPNTIKNVAKQILLKLLLRTEQFRSIYYKDSLASEGIPQPQPSLTIWDDTLENLIAPYIRHYWEYLR